MYVPTTVFTPLEYGACGLAEEDARAIFGDGNIDVSVHTRHSSQRHSTCECCVVDFTTTLQALLLVFLLPVAGVPCLLPATRVECSS